MNKDITFCSALFCPIDKDCLRRGHFGQPFDPDQLLSFADFSKKGLHINKEQELVCDAKLTK